MKSYKKEFWQEYAMKKRRIIVFKGADVLDLTSFAKKHPGGEKAIMAYMLMDIKDILFRVYPHPKNAEVTLSKYRCGLLAGYQETNNPDEKLRKGICPQKTKKEKKQKGEKNVCFQADSQDEESKLNVLEKNSILLLENKQEEESEIIEFEEEKPELRVPLFLSRLQRNTEWLNK